MKKVCIIWEIAFHRLQLRLVIKNLPHEFIGGVAAKTMRLSSYNDSNNFKQSDSSTSPWSIRYEAVV